MKLVLYILFIKNVWFKCVWINIFFEYVYKLLFYFWIVLEEYFIKNNIGSCCDLILILEI